MPIYHNVKIEESIWKVLREFQMKRESLSAAIARLLKLSEAVRLCMEDFRQTPEYQAWKGKKEVTKE